MSLLMCPRCGATIPASAMNCGQCRINLRFALEHPEEVQRLKRRDHGLPDEPSISTPERLHGRWISASSWDLQIAAAPDRVVTLVASRLRSLWRAIHPRRHPVPNLSNQPQLPYPRSGFYCRGNCD